MSGTEDFQTFAREAFATLLAGLSTLGARVDGIVTRLDGIDTRLARIETRQDALEAALVKTRSDMMERMDRLQTTLDVVREDVAVNMNAATTAINNVRNIRADYESLFDMVITMHRQQMKLTARVDELSKPPEERLRPTGT